jgi:hypothetical protein
MVVVLAIAITGAYACGDGKDVNKQVNKTKATNQKSTVDASVAKTTVQTADASVKAVQADACCPASTKATTAQAKTMDGTSCSKATTANMKTVDADCPASAKCPAGASNCTKAAKDIKSTVEKNDKAKAKDMAAIAPKEDKNN